MSVRDAARLLVVADNTNKYGGAFTCGWGPAFVGGHAPPLLLDMVDGSNCEQRRYLCSFSGLIRLVSHRKRAFPSWLFME